MKKLTLAIGLIIAAQAVATTASANETIYLSCQGTTIIYENKIDPYDESISIRIDNDWVYVSGGIFTGSYVLNRKVTSDVRYFFNDYETHRQGNIDRINGQTILSSLRGNTVLYGFNGVCLPAKQLF